MDTSSEYVLAIENIHSRKQYDEILRYLVDECGVKEEWPGYQQAFYCDMKPELGVQILIDKSGTNVFTMAVPNTVPKEFTLDARRFDNA